MTDIYKVLEDLHIAYVRHAHSAVFTVDEAEKYDRQLGAGASKNLFLRNKKETAYYLIIVQSRTRVDLKKLATELGESKLSFGSPEKMFELLGLTPGSVSPFGLINDKDNIVTVIIDNGLVKHKTVGFHPNINTATLVISSEDFKKYLSSTGNAVQYLSVK